MAPVKISHIVSFSSQDPRYPVENLLCPDGRQPWLSCPKERSRQLKVELQLERAVPIGYIDIGNWGCAFLHIEVGRSSWPLDRPYLTLVPSVALMTPSDSKLGRNRCNVRMFKEADFLVLAAGQKWDRLRLTCSQPFHRCGQFGLCFIRVRTALEPELCLPAADDAEHTGSPKRSSPASSCRIPSAEAQLSSNEEQLKSSLQQLEPSAASHAWNPACLSRPARMVLSATQSRAMRPPPRVNAGVGSSTEQGQPVVRALEGPAAPKRARRQPCSRAGGRNPEPGGRARAQDESSDGDVAPCPICSGTFSTALLPAHASRCGEEDSEPEVELLCSASSPVMCPICGLCFSAMEVEQHCSTCGE
ncbi:protein XNDC1N isoform X2 [Excalfactoria chinensis]|uniref:protein XNDC1N isoform X2 n=1 Tax=Excalfactoria chinensis TaxID=46218 RepID=UPI003B3BDC7A